MNFRSATVLALLVAATFSLGQDATKKITLELPAVPVSRALAELSKQSGEKLEAMPAMSRDIVILSLKDAAYDAVKQRLAVALAAKWEASDSGLRLVPDSAARRLEAQKEQSDYTEAVSKSLTKLVEALNPPKTDPKNKEATQAQLEMAAQFGFGGGGSATSKAVIRLAKAIGAPTLANIDEKSRVVFSSNPTRMQRPMPNGSNAILAQLVQEFNAEVAKRQKAKSEKPQNQEEDERVKKLMEFFGNFEDRDTPIEGTPTKALLVCTRQPLFGGISMALKVYNEKGQVVITGTQTLMTNDNFMADLNMEFDAQGNPKPKAPTQVPDGEKPIQFSDSAKEFQGATNFMALAQGGGKLGSEIRAKLLNPEMYDPLSFTHSEALIQTAKQRGKQLIAVLPDDMDSILSMATAKPESLSPTGYLQSIKNSATATTDGDWLLVRPNKPQTARDKRLDRAALGAFLRSVDKKGSFSLDDLAAYAQKANAPMEEGGAMVYMMIFAPNAIQSGMAGTVNWDMLRFYGSLSTLQRKNLVDGSRMAFNQCTPAQLASIRQMAFGPDEALEAEDPNAKKPDFEMPQMWRRLFSAAAGGDYRTEPTEVMPNGLPPEGFVELHFTSETIAKPAGNLPAMFGNSVLGADELALLKMFRESESMQQFAAMMPNIEEMRLGQRSIYEFKFTVAQGVTMSHNLNDDRVDSNSPIVKSANLPADFQKAIEQRLVMMKKIPFFDPAFLGGRQVIPPATQ